MNTLAPLSLADAKMHLKIDDDDEFENNYIQNLIEVATDFCEQRINRSIDDVFTELGYMPKALSQYIFVVMTEMHTNRQLTTTGAVKVNPFYERLIDKYVDYEKGV